MDSCFWVILPFSKYAPELFLLVSFLIWYIPHTCLLYFICSSTKIHLFLQITKFGYRLCRPPSVFSEISFKKIIFLKDISMYRFWCLLYYKNSLLWLDLIKLLSVVLTNRGIRLPFPRKVRQSLCLFVWCTDFFLWFFQYICNTNQWDGHKRKKRSWWTGISLTWLRVLITEALPSITIQRYGREIGHSPDRDGIWGGDL